MAKRRWRGRSWSDAVDDERPASVVPHPHNPKTAWSTGEVLKAIPNLTNRQLGYLCQSGRMGQERIDPGTVRWFSQADIAVLTRFANLREAGIDLPVAFRVAQLQPGT